MWNSKPSQANPPGTSPAPGTPAPSVSAGPAVRAGVPPVRSTAAVGASIRIQGQISGDEPLQIDGRVDGPVSLRGQRLTVGATAELTSEVVAREIIVHGKVRGNLQATDRVEIKKGGSVIGDITTARIMIEDGAHFKGRIEIDQARQKPSVDLVGVGIPAAVQAS